MAFIEVIPIHLINSHCEHHLVIGIDSFLYHPVIEQFVDIDSSSVPEVEDKRMSECLGPHVIGLILSEHAEKLLVKGVGLEEILFDGFFDVGVFLDEDSLAAKLLTHGL